MEKFYTGVVKHRKIILTLFILAAVICLLLKGLIPVNYDINDYLPEDSPSTVSINTMEEEFEGGIPNARVMIRNVTIPKAMVYKEKLKQIDGVTDVLWLDDTTDIRIPLEAAEGDNIEPYYKENTALFTVTLAEDKRIEAVKDIRHLIGDKNAVTGNAVSTADATTSTVKEVGIIAVLAVLFAFLVLLLTTPSWLEPVVILIGLGVAIAINGGTNLIFGEISFVTNSAGSILQLAVSLDYSVFLIHRFEECLKSESDPKKAMVNALCKSTTSILSSGLTTVIGFLALIFMRFEIGPDLGLALAKGVTMSLITVFVFMPALIVTAHEAMEKTRHRPFMPSFQKFGKVISKAMIPCVCVFVLIITPAYLASNSNSYYYGTAHIFGTDTKLGADMAAVEKTFGKSGTYVLLVPRGDPAKEKQLSEQLHSLPQIDSIVSYVDAAGAEVPTEYVDSQTLGKLMSNNYSRMVISVKADAEGNETFSLIEKIRAIAEEYYPGTFYFAGEGVSTYDLMNTVTQDMTKVNLIAIGAVFFILLIMMKSVFVPAILVLSIETAIWINLAIPFFTGSPIFYVAYLIISSVQLGATVDYAILFTDRYKEMRQTLSKKDAIVDTVSATIVSILTSGSVLTVVGFLMGNLSSHRLLAQLGLLLGKGTLCSLIIVLFVLPGLLYVLDRLVIGNGRVKRKVEALKEGIKK